MMRARGYHEKQSGLLSIVTVMDDMMFIDFSNLYVALISPGKGLDWLRGRIQTFSSETLLTIWMSLIPKHWKHQSVIGLVMTANINFVIQLLSLDAFIGTKFIFNVFNRHLYGKTFLRIRKNLVAQGASKVLRVFDCEVQKIFLENLFLFSASMLVLGEKKGSPISLRLVSKNLTRNQIVNNNECGINELQKHFFSLSLDVKPIKFWKNSGETIIIIYHLDVKGLDRHL